MQKTQSQWPACVNEMPVWKVLLFPCSKSKGLTETLLPSPGRTLGGWSVLTGRPRLHGHSETRNAGAWVYGSMNCLPSSQLRLLLPTAVSHSLFSAWGPEVLSTAGGSEQLLDLWIFFFPFKNHSVADQQSGWLRGQERIPWLAYLWAHLYICLQLISNFGGGGQKPELGCSTMQMANIGFLNKW